MVSRSLLSLVVLSLVYQESSASPILEWLADSLDIESWWQRPVDQSVLKVSPHQNHKSISGLSCPSNPALSCSNKFSESNSCCFEHPGGLVLQTQFWDYKPAIGPKDSWTIHGLWPDNCDGSYEAFCDSSLDIKPEEIYKLLKDNGHIDLLEKMESNWVDDQGVPENLWAHEFNKHATCYSTLQPGCYTEDEVKNLKYIIDYFNITVNLFEKLPTFEWLAEYGIVPSTGITYKTEAAIEAIKKSFGQQVHLGCDENGALNEIWYYFNAYGSLRNEDYKPTDTTFKTTCGDTFHYYPKGYDSILTAATSSVSLKEEDKIDLPFPVDISCPTSLPPSCSNKTVIENSCCFEYGGIILQTQFWDYNPGTGPNDSFTLHGLWPDDCDGGYHQYCDSAMNIKNPRAILKTFNGGDELVQDMAKYWKDYKDNDDYLWEHEFNKHGTCYSTLKPKCYGDKYVQNEAVYDYFKIAVNLFKTVPTYDWLVSEGITPSTTEEYTKDEILAALTKHFGYEPFISCDYHNNLNQVWYFHLLQGSILTEDFLKIDAVTPSRCKATGIKFMPKSPKRTPTRPTTTLHGPPRPTSPGTIGNIKLSGQPGCLIKNGKWYVSGTCARFSLIKLPTGSVNIKSSAGYCSILDDGFTCSSQIHQPFEFDYDVETGIIGANGKSIWHSDDIPRRFKQEPVLIGDGGAAEFRLHFT